MCGISGFVDFQGKSTLKILESMTDTLRHRGPDNSGCYFNATSYGTLGLGHRRLSIIDLNKESNQPMKTENNRWVITYNGEIYNFQEIRVELQQAGYYFKTQSDTEVILHAFNRWGQNAIHRFIGMFAFALLDNLNHKLFLYRDRGGAKPLYYYWKDNLFLFASELKSFHEHPCFDKKLNNSAIQPYLQYGCIPAPYSIYENTYKLQPGHSIVFDLLSQGLKVEKYWDIAEYYSKPELDISEEEALIETEKLIQSACAYRMVSDVPVGIFLSGGYDSSLIAAILQKNYSQKIKTFTVAFDDHKLNEAPFAKKIAQYIGTDHHELFCSVGDAISVIQDIPYFYDEPFADFTAVPTILLSRFARKEVTVALSGDAGDELFAGYKTYDNMLRLQKLRDFLPLPIRPFIAEIIGNIGKITQQGSIKWSKKADFLSKMKDFTVAPDLVVAMRKYEIFSRSGIDQLIGSTLKNNSLYFFSQQEYINENDNLLKSLLIFDYKQYLSDDLLTKVDRATMSTGLEGREPLLDHRLAEFAAQLPSHFKKRNSETKYLLRQITHRHLPIELMERPKMGFSAPLSSWVRDKEFIEITECYLNKKNIEDSGIFNWEEILRIKKAAFDGRSGYAHKLWYVLSFEMWRNRWEAC